MIPLFQRFHSTLRKDAVIQDNLNILILQNSARPLAGDIFES
jgi:hypothetical protein